jgi:hypothetical protein
VYTGCCWGNLREGNRLENPGVDERMVLKWIFKNWDGGDIAWIVVAQNVDKWRALVNAVMNLLSYIKRGEFLDWPRTCKDIRKNSAPWT